MKLRFGSEITPTTQHSGGPKQADNMCLARRAFELILSSILLSVWFATVPASALQVAKASPGKIMDSLPAAHGLSDVAISPDGHHVAWTSGPQIFITDLQEPASK